MIVYMLLHSRMLTGFFLQQLQPVCRRRHGTHWQYQSLVQEQVFPALAQLRHAPAVPHRLIPPHVPHSSTGPPGAGAGAGSGFGGPGSMPQLSAEERASLQSQLNESAAEADEMRERMKKLEEIEVQKAAAQVSHDVREEAAVLTAFHSFKTFFHG